MTTDDTIFKFEDGYILLEDLESWFSHGFVTPDDNIRIFDKSRKPKIYKISYLIKVYGEQFPFRRKPIVNKHELLADCDEEIEMGPSTSNKKMGGAFGVRRSVTPEEVTRNTENQFIYVDFPLYNVDNESEEDRITGQEVIDEMNKLRLVFPTRKRSKDMSNLFYFLCRKLNEDKEGVVICRLCNFTPFIPRKFFTHLFSRDHIQKLSEHHISKSSFKFWANHFEKFAEQTSTDLRRISTATDSARNEKPKESEVPVQKRVILKVDTPEANQISAPSTSKDSESSAQETTASGNIPRVPLFDRLRSAPRCTRKLKGQSFVEKIRNMVKVMSRKGREAAMRIRVNWKCEYCSTKTRTVQFLTEIDAFNHLTSQFHMEKMRFTAPIGDLEFWMKWVLNINSKQINSTENETRSTQELLIKPSPLALHIEKSSVVSNSTELDKYPESRTSDAINNVSEVSKVSLVQKSSEDNIRIFDGTEVGPSTSIGKMGGAFGVQKSGKPEELTKNTENPFIYMDFPLYNVENESEEDRITGQEVYDEMEKLRTTFETQKWYLKHRVHFFFLNRKSKGGKEELIICRLCNFRPLTPRSFFLHLFDENHIDRLAKHQISKSSFKFWADHFDECSRVEGLKSEHLQRTFKTIPLLFPYENQDRKLLNPTEISTLQELFSQIDARILNKEDGFLVKFFNSTYCSDFCDFCRYSMPIRAYNITKHILSENHLKSLTGISREQYNFWLNYLRVEVANKNVKNQNTCRILTNRNSPSVPLIDFKMESRILDESLRLPKIGTLTAAYKSLNTKDWKTEFSIGFKGGNVIECHACSSSDTNKTIIKTQAELVEHIFSKQHSEYLLQFGFSEISCSWWMKWFGNAGVTIPKIEEPKRSEILVQKSVILNVDIPAANQIFVPSTSKTSESSIQETSTSGNIPRVPLFDCFPNAPRCTQEFFIHKFRNMAAIMSKNGREAARRNRVNWKCGYCSTKMSTFKFSTELEAFDHLNSQKHKEKMKFTAPIGDLEFWMKWVVNINSKQINSTENKTQPSPLALHVEKSSVVSNSTELEKYPESRTSDAINNVSEVSKVPKIKTRTDVQQCPEARRTSIVSKIPEIMSIVLKPPENKESAKVGKAIEVDKIRAIKTAPEAPKVPEVGKTVEVSKTSVTQRSSTSTNSSRIPMIDPMPRNETPVTKEKFNEILDECAEVFRKDRRRIEFAKNSVVYRDCSYCSTPSRRIRPSNCLDVLLHITKTEHREKMQYKACLSDLEYWKNWAITFSRQKTMEQKPPPAPTVPTVSKVPEIKKATEVSKAPVSLIGFSNIPRIPMIDQMPLNEKPVTKEKFNEILDECADIFKKDRKRIEVAKNLPVNWHCTYCSTSSRRTLPSNLLDTFLHITKEGHREKMQYKACLSDLEYWKKWAMTFGALQQIVEQKPPSVVAGISQSCSSVKPVSNRNEARARNSQEKNEPFKKPSNALRIPLLDVPKSQGNLISQTIYKKRYNDIREQLKSRKPCKETDQKMTCYCFHCPGVVRITSIYELMHHVFDGKHDTNIRYCANSSDFDYFDELIKKMPLATNAPLSANISSSGVLKSTR